MRYIEDDGKHVYSFYLLRLMRRCDGLGRPGNETRASRLDPDFSVRDAAHSGPFITQTLVTFYFLLLIYSIIFMSMPAD